MTSKKSIINENSNYKISVIVAVYKVELYIKKCLDSLIAQTFDDFEILLIDDGSPDNSGKICDEYAKRFSNIKVFHKQNEGVGATRQFGLDNATGEYVIHVDPDDWVEPKMLSELYAKAKTDDADMVICDFILESTGESYIKKQNIKFLDNFSVFKSLVYHKIQTAPWNKLIRRSCFYKYDVKFPQEMPCGEDLFMLAQLLTNNIKISYLSKNFYHYTQNINQNSLSAINSYTQNFDHVYKQVSRIDKYVKVEPYNSIFKKATQYCLCSAYFGNHIFSSKEYKHFFGTFKSATFSNATFLYGCMLYFSCLGFYEPMYKMHKLLQKIKKLTGIK